MICKKQGSIEIIYTEGLCVSSSVTMRSIAVCCKCRTIWLINKEEIVDSSYIHDKVIRSWNIGRTMVIPLIVMLIICLSCCCPHLFFCQYDYFMSR